MRIFSLSVTTITVRLVISLNMAIELITNKVSRRDWLNTWLYDVLYTLLYALLEYHTIYTFWNCVIIIVNSICNIKKCRKYKNCQRFNTKIHKIKHNNGYNDKFCFIEKDWMNHQMPAFAIQTWRENIINTKWRGEVDRLKV